MRGHRAVALMAFMLVAGAGFIARAQGEDQNPSVQDMISALKPGNGTVRGSKPFVLGGNSDPSIAGTGVAAGQVSHGEIDVDILFVSGSAELTPAADRAIGMIGSALNSPELMGSKFRIEGHTDTVGTPDRNLALSARRARAVVSDLSTRYGVSPQRLEAVGMGQQGLRKPTDDQVSEPSNRRVRIVNITG